MKFDYELCDAIFIKKRNRFIAEVLIDGKEDIAHIANTGRLGEILYEGAPVVLSHHPGEERKTNYTLRFGYHNNHLISIDSQLPNKVVKDAFINKIIPGYEDYDEVKSEVKIGKSRIDILLKNGDKKCYIEVKGVTLVPNGIAKFPDAPTSRGVKHIEELIELKKSGIDTGIFFLVQREDALKFMPNGDTDPLFAKTLKKAKKAGVDILIYKCKVTKDEIKIIEAVKADF